MNPGQNIGSLKALRVFKGLRPLRVISKDEGLKLIVSALLNSIPALGNVLMVSSLFLFLFAIIGLNLFSGMFYSCVMPHDLDSSTSEI